jgi:hypothetical protein
MVLLNLDRSTGDGDGGAWSQAEVVGGGEGLRRSALVPEVRRGDIAGGSGGEVAPKGMGRRGDSARSRMKGWALALCRALTRGPGNCGSGAGCGIE